MPALVIPTQHKEGVGEKDFVAVEQEDAFAAEVAAIHVIAEEEVPLVPGSPAHLEQLQQVVKLEGETGRKNYSR